MPSKDKGNATSHGGLVNKGKNAITKKLREKKYVSETASNFELLEKGLDESNIKTAKRWYALGAKRGAIMLAQAIENEQIAVHQDDEGFYFIVKEEVLCSSRKLKIKSGKKTIEKSKKLKIKLNKVFHEK